MKSLEECPETGDHKLKHVTEINALVREIRDASSNNGIIFRSVLLGTAPQFNSNKTNNVFPNAFLKLAFSARREWCFL